VITSWSPSRLSKWEECPRRAQYEVVQKLCPSCFKGALAGPWGQAQVCDTCGVVEVVGEALSRGTMLHGLCEEYVTGDGKLPPQMKNVATQLKGLRRTYREGLTTIEEDLVFRVDWAPTGKSEKGAWLRARLDVLTVRAGHAQVIDWKSGGIDKRTGQVKDNPAYRDQLEIYACAVLSAKPAVEEVEAFLVFIDAPAGKNVVTVGGTARRADLPALQKKWAGRARGMLSDTLFAPRPGFSCRWCPFGRAKGGPNSPCNF